MEQTLSFKDLGLSEQILQALEKKGYGYPTQESMVEKVFANPTDAEAYANGIGSDDMAAFKALIPEGSSITIDGIDKTMSASTAYVTLKTPKGGDVPFRVQMVRDMIGWKVSDLDLYFASQQ